MPSAAIGVATHGTPAARLDATLPLAPAPKRNGATVSRNPSNHGPTSGTWPSARTRPGTPASSPAGHPSPTTVISMSGAARSTSGQISARNHRIASRFGACAKLPMNPIPRRAANGVAGGATSRASGNTIARTSGISSRRCASSASDTTTVASLARITACSRARTCAATAAASVPHSSSACRSSRR